MIYYGCSALEERIMRANGLKPWPEKAGEALYRAFERWQVSGHWAVRGSGATTRMLVHAVMYSLRGPVLICCPEHSDPKLTARRMLGLRFLAKDIAYNAGLPHEGILGRRPDDMSGVIEIWDPIGRLTEVRIDRWTAADYGENETHQAVAFVRATPAGTRRRSTILGVPDEFRGTLGSLRPRCTGS